MTDPRDYYIQRDEFREIELTDVATEYGKELDKALATAFMRGAVAVDVCWTGDIRSPAPEIVTWYEDPGPPKDRVDAPIDSVTRYDLESVEIDEFLDALDEAPYSWEDISETNQ